MHIFLCWFTESKNLVIVLACLRRPQFKWLASLLRPGYHRVCFPSENVFPEGGFVGREEVRYFLYSSECVFRWPSPAHRHAQTYISDAKYMKLLT